LQERSLFSSAVSTSVLAAAPEGILVLNREGQIVLVNSQTEELLRYAADELLGKHFDVVLPESFREEHERQIAGCRYAPGARRDRVELVLSAVCKDGEKLLLNISVGCTNVHGEPLVCCIMREAEAPGETMQERYEAEVRFRLMVENSEDILGIRNADGTFRYANPSFQRVLGYKQEEIIGCTGFDLIHPEDRPRFDSLRGEFMKNPGARDSLQFRALHANGSWVTLEGVAHNLLGDPDIQGVVINLRDISECKQAEAEKEKLASELQEAAAKASLLTGLLSICASCKKVKDEAGHWEQIESYFRERSEVEFSHGMCPECAKLWFPDEFAQ